MDNLKKYVINLKRRPDRLEKFYNKSNFQKEDVEVVYGFDGKNFDNESEIEKNMYNRLHNNLMPGEKGCFISHLRICKDIVDKKITFAIIMEDDAEFCDDFKIKLDELICQMPSKTQIMYVGGRFNNDFKMEPGTFIPITQNIVSHTNVKWNNRNVINHDRCAHAYIISYSLAEYFIRCFESKIYLNVAFDHWMIRLCMDNDITIYNSYPLLCYSDGWSKDSDIRGHLV
jgi:GR25 family glycosyltransferase involved in LPS biosynthesis